MLEQADLIVDRRKLKRGLIKWRLLTVGFALLALLATTLFNSKFAAKLGIHDQIARVEISGIIVEDRARGTMLKQIAANPSVKAVLVKFNSPGGTTTGGEELYLQLRELAETRPVVAVFGTMATSAAYMAGVAADHVVARGNSITGSVGVIMQWAEVSGMMGKLGIEMNEMKSGSLKAVPTPFAPLSDEGRALTQAMIDESHKWFVDLVVDRRKINPEQIDGFMKGRIFSGRQALIDGLIDEIGGEDQALDWLYSKKNIAKHLPVMDWQEKKDVPSGIFSKASSFAAGMLGFELQPMVDSLAQRGLVSSHSMQLISKWRKQ